MENRWHTQFMVIPGVSNTKEQAGIIEETQIVQEPGVSTWRPVSTFKPKEQGEDKVTRTQKNSILLKRPQ